MSDGLDLLEEQQPTQVTAPRKPVQTKEPEQIATVPVCQPDVWDVNGRLISNDRNNPI